MELLIGLAAPAVLVFGIVLGRWQRKHRHIWTPWTRIWDEEKQELLKDQERFCKTCNLREDQPHVSGDCPPHRWGKWEDTMVVPSGKLVSEPGQKRSCLNCGAQVLRRVNGVEPK